MAPEGGAWGAIFAVPYIGRTIDWYIENIIAPGVENKYEIFNELAAKADSGADGLKINLRKAPEYLNASRENISRAVMEGAAELFNEKLKELASSGIKFNKAVMVGGPSKSPVWPQIVEETTGINLTVGSTACRSERRGNYSRNRLQQSEIIMDIETVFNANDRKIYENEFRDWLPEKIFDAHVHAFDADNFKADYELPGKKLLPEIRRDFYA